MIVQYFMIFKKLLTTKQYLITLKILSNEALRVNRSLRQCAWPSQTLRSLKALPFSLFPLEVTAGRFTQLHAISYMRNLMEIQKLSSTTV